MNQSLLPDDCLPHLDELNALVKSSGAPLEGNLFYRHHEPDPGRGNVYDYFYKKRVNFAAFCDMGTRLLEIGLNAGHSALLALSRGVEYHGVDICRHAYTQPCADYLQEMFGERFHFYAGDSLKVLPQLHATRPALTFDLLHIDGHHGIDFCRADSENAMKMAEPRAWILIDDTDMKPIAQFYEEQLAAGRISAEKPAGWSDNRHHGVGRLA